MSESAKRFEVRLADFDCKEDDTLVLKEQKNGTDTLTDKTQDCEILYKFNTKDMEKYHTKEDIEKYGFIILSIRKKFNHE
ncbi:MAG: hypothetical protein K0B07_00185 [DPANN group archaeon]|nr:hypothetical protein [DPANN group archaeon]